MHEIPTDFAALRERAAALLPPGVLLGTEQKRHPYMQVLLFGVVGALHGRRCGDLHIVDPGGQSLRTFHEDVATPESPKGLNRYLSFTTLAGTGEVRIDTGMWTSLYRPDGFPITHTFEAPRDGIGVIQIENLGAKHLIVHVQNPLRPDAYTGGPYPATP